MITRRSLLAAPALITAASSLPALARAPLAQAPMPAAYRFKVGSIEVTAIADGTLPLSLELLPESGRAPQVTSELLRQVGHQGGPVRNFVNAYLVNTGDQLVLIDTGAGPSKDFGPDLGRLQANLAAAGISPAQVDVVFLTHLHPDHVGGLSLQGQAAFANAELAVGEAEYAFWHDAGIAARAPAEAQAFFKAAQDAVRPYGAKTRRIASGEIVPGVSLVPAPGHTPGHTAVRVASGSDQLLIWGDVVIMPVLQFARPDWSAAFDTDQALAATTRKRLLDMTAADRMLVAGMHLPFPGVGHVIRAGEGFSFVPQQWPTG